MLKLPEATRAKYDLSSLKSVFHAAAPCPVPVKEAMIAWWGPIVNEYYAGTEGNGFTAINSEEWLTKKGSVRPRPSLGEGEGLTTNSGPEPLPARPKGADLFRRAAGRSEYHKRSGQDHRGPPESLATRLDDR